MKQRWLPVAVVAGALFAVNALARFAVWALSVESADKQVGFGLAAMAAAVLVAAYAGWRWACRYPMPQVVADLAVAVVVGALLSTLGAPLAGGDSPVGSGVGAAIALFWQHVAVGAGGVLFGVLVAVATGRDYRAQALKRYEEHVRSRPRKVVRR